MHSKIFQISSKPIPKAKWDNGSDYFEQMNGAADYIGDEQENDDRKDCIANLAGELKDLFTLDEKGTALVYKGADGLKAFKKAWSDAIHEQAALITPESVVHGACMERYILQSMCNQTHLRTSFRVNIEEWNGYPSPMEDMIEWIDHEGFKRGKKVYIGSVFDYHF